MFDTVLWGKGPGLRGNWVEDLADGFLRCMGLLSQRQSHVSANFSARSADYSDHRPVCAVMSPAVAQNSTNTPRFESDIDANQALNDIYQNFLAVMAVPLVGCLIISHGASLAACNPWGFGGWQVEQLSEIKLLSANFSPLTIFLFKLNSGNTKHIQGTDIGFWKL